VRAWTPRYVSMPARYRPPPAVGAYLEQGVEHGGADGQGRQCVLLRRLQPVAELLQDAAVYEVLVQLHPDVRSSEEN